MRSVVATSLTLVLLVSAVSGCLFDTDSEAEDRARLQRLEAEIDALVGTPACSDSSVCAFLGVGSKACGGFRRYVIFSKSSTDTARLMEKVQYLNALEDYFNHKYGWGSDCSVPRAPKVRCVDGICVDLNQQED